MNVLFLNHCLGYGGATKSLILMQKSLNNKIDIYTAIKKQKNLILDIKNEFKNSKEFIEFELPLIYSHSDGTISTKEFETHTLFYPQQLINYINEKRIDILHINCTLFPHLLRPIKENTNCKIIVHVREMLPNGVNHLVDKYMIDTFTHYADAIIAISDNEIKHFDFNEKIHIIPNPHDFSTTNSYLMSNNERNQRIVIGMCANFLEIKGHLDFLETAIIINNKFKNSKLEIEFKLIGYPKDNNSLKEFAKRIIRYGYKSRFDTKVKKLKLTNLTIIPFTFDIYHELADFDIYVRPDISGNPWGRDIIEAMAMRKPVIATGTSEFFVKNNETGYLVPVREPDKMAERIIFLIKNPKLRETMGNQAYDFISDKCDLNLYGNKIMKLYNQLCEC